MAAARAAEAALHGQAAGREVVRDVGVVGRVELVEQREEPVRQPARVGEPGDAVAVGQRLVVPRNGNLAFAQGTFDRFADFTPDPDTTVISNEAGIKGGIALWRD